MESKYKERAKELLKESITDSSGYICRNYNESDLIIIMCQLAEEVELETTRLCSDTGLDLLINQAKTMYTREQVEELLQKQRELSENAALQDKPIYCQCGRLHAKDCSYVIRSTKLKID